MTLRTIVVVEDDPVLRQDTVDMLEAADLAVVAFADGDQALDYLHHHQDGVAAVFTDVNLATDTDGLRVAHLVADFFPGIVVIVTSGQYAERPPGLCEGARYLPKPWLPLDVVNALIDSAQDGQRYGLP